MTFVAKEEPYAAVVADEHLSTICSHCFHSLTSTKIVCKSCGHLSYCNEVCRKKDRREHRGECNMIKAVPLFTEITGMKNLRIAVRIYFKRKRETAGKEKPYVCGFNSRTFDDLMDHGEKVENDPIKSKLLRKLFEMLATLFLLSKESVNELKTIINKVNVNAFGVEDGDHLVGKALYIGLSIHDHSCRPQAYVIFKEKQAMLMVPGDVGSYSKDLLISYMAGSMLKPRSWRKTKLLESYYFDCQCSLCTDDQNDSLLRSLRCNKCSGVCPVLETDSISEKVRCQDCFQQQTFTNSEALLLNEKLLSEVEELGRQKTTALTKVLVEKLEEYTKVFSKINGLLADFAREVLSKSANIVDQRLASWRFFISEKYGYVPVDAYRKYLPIGHPDLTTVMLLAATRARNRTKVSREDLEIAEESCRLMSISHGEGRHPFCKEAHIVKETIENRLKLEK